MNVKIDWVYSKKPNVQNLALKKMDDLIKTMEDLVETLKKDQRLSLRDLRKMGETFTQLIARFGLSGVPRDDHETKVEAMHVGITTLHQIKAIMKTLFPYKSWGSLPGDAAEIDNEWKYELKPEKPGQKNYDHVTMDGKKVQSKLSNGPGCFKYRTGMEDVDHALVVQDHPKGWVTIILNAPMNKVLNVNGQDGRSNRDNHNRTASGKILQKSVEDDERLPIKRAFREQEE